MPQCILSSSMWIAQQNVAQTQRLMPTAFAFNLQITSSSKLASPILEDKMKPNKNKCFSEQRLGFSNGISKLGTPCLTNHTAILCKREQNVLQREHLPSELPRSWGGPHSLWTPATYALRWGQPRLSSLFPGILRQHRKPAFHVFCCL